MASIQYLTGDATSPKKEGYKIIAHICNDVGGWGKGFVMALSNRWKAPEMEYREWYRRDHRLALGEIQMVEVEEGLAVANMIGQKGIRPTQEGPPIRYEAVEQCLRSLAVEASARNATVHIPRIGCGLAGGKWESIEPLIIKCLIDKDINVFVYDLDDK